MTSDVFIVLFYQRDLIEKLDEEDKKGQCYELLVMKTNEMQD